MSSRVLTGHDAVMRIEAEAAIYGIRRTTDANGRARFEAACGHCGRQVGMFNSSVNHVEQVMSHFHKQGWIFAQKTPPYCSTQHVRDAKRSQKIERREEMKTLPPVAPKPEPAPAPPPPPMIASNPKIVIRVVTLLNMHFDKESRLYNPGWSDERIAKEAETSLDFVISYRKGGYGELAEDPEATKLRSAIKVVEDKVFALSGEIDELKARLDRLAARAHIKAQG